MRLFRPSATAESLAAVNLDDLQGRGINFIVLDLDNTMVAWRKFDVPESVERWIADALARGMKLCIVSNTWNCERLERIAGELGIPSLSRATKPSRKGFRAAMALMGSEPQNTAAIGDQTVTDVIGGNRVGLYTILVRPIPSPEFIGTKINRLLEKLILWLLRRKSMSGTKPGQAQSEREKRA